MKNIKNNQLRISDLNKEVTLFGFVANKRKMGALTFVDLRDRWGIVQLVLDKEFAHFSKESVLKVEGIVIERQNKNPNLLTGDIEIQVRKIDVISLAEQLPFNIIDELEAKEDTRLSHRFLDLRRPTMIKNLTIRHKFVKAFRDFLDKEDFLEIETPYLSKSTPEGARDYLVPTREKGKFFALPQSPQLYKQLLMAGGIEKYFQVVRAFRDEDLRNDRQPEFTQLDLELSYADTNDIKHLVENLMQHSFEKLGIKISIPFKSMDYFQALDEYGSDKPDLRFSHKLLEVTKYFNNPESNFFKNSSSIKALFFEKELSKKHIQILEEIAKKNKAPGLIWESISESGEINGPGNKFISKEILEIRKDFGLKNGTILFVGSTWEHATQALGAVRKELNNIFHLAKQEYNFVWIENWPLFEYNAETNTYSAAHHPFTSPSDASLKDFDIDPSKATAKAYDLVLNGYEIAGGSIRIHDSNVQERMFNAINLTKEQQSQKFGFFLEAFKYGLPPHAGIAFGLDRLIMILTSANSIRDVIAFPKNASGKAVMEEAPSSISKEQLDEYGLKLDIQK